MGVFVNRIIKVLGDQINYRKEEERFLGAQWLVSANQRCLPRSVLSLENFDMNSSSGIFNKFKLSSVEM